MRQPTIYEQLSFDQKKRLWEYLVSIGLPQHEPKRPRGRKSATKEWQPKTAAGRACKARLAIWKRLPPIEGIKTYQVRHPNGDWLMPGQLLFEEAVAYQRKYWADPENHKGKLWAEELRK